MKKIAILILFLLLIPAVFAKQGHMTLLAVSESDSGYKGETAELYLELNRGSGRVFLDTYPFTKLDTQMSTRFAKEIACNYLNIECDNFDFIYTIKASSAIIGGPSAGAAITVLTIAMLENLKLAENATITGTINSGGLIGPVGGVKEKIDAGIASGMRTILIPKGERFFKPLEQQARNSIFEILNTTNNNSSNSSNETIDLIDYGTEKGAKIIEVSSIDDVLQAISDKKISQGTKSIEVSSFYADTMKGLSIKLCNRGTKIREQIDESLLANESLTFFKDGINLTSKGTAAFNDKLYYASASYCFGASVKYKYAAYLQKNYSNKQILEIIKQGREVIENFTAALEHEELKTLTDLESYIIVKERLLDASSYLDDSWLTINDSKEALSNLAYAIERIYSAYAWNTFYGKGNKEFVLNQDIIKKSCISKLAEAEERYQYFILFIPFGLDEAKKEIEQAHTNMDKQDYKMCLFEASKAKSTVDGVLSTVGVENSKLDELLLQKLDAAQKTINRQISKGIFPILGYSYFEYAKSLKESNIYSALIYVEDALELSNLDLYFKEKKRLSHFEVDMVYVWIFSLGFFCGFLALFLISHNKKAKNVKNPGKALVREPSWGKRGDRKNPRKRFQRKRLRGKKR
jgi:uncharacterized protein